MTGISLGIPMFRSERFLAELLDRLGSLDPAPKEIVFLDDASPDNCFAIATEFSNQARYPTRVYRNASNCGIAATYNRLVTESQGEWIHILDADDYPVESDFYARIAPHLRPENNLVVAGIESTSRLISFGNRLLAPLVPSRPPRCLPLLGSLATRSGVIYRRAIVKRHPFPEPAYPGSDVIHLLRLRELGGLIFDRYSHIHYRIHEGATSSQRRDYTTFARELGEFDLASQLMHRFDLTLRVLGQRWERT